MFPTLSVRIEVRIFGECLVPPKVLFFPFSSSVRTPCVRSSSSEDRKETASAKMCGDTDSDLFFLSFCCTMRKRERERERTSLDPPLYGDDMVSFFFFFQILEHNPFPTTFCVGIPSVLFLLSARTRTYLWELQCFFPFLLFGS